MSDLSADRLKELLHYDPETGVFTWRVDRGHRFKAGQTAGSISPQGYIQIGVDGRDYKAHRLAFLYMTGKMPAEKDVDHENEIKSDNRWENLRDASRSQNTFNTGMKSHNTSGFKGVSFHKNRWVAEIRVNMKKIHLGRFTDPEAAHRAYIAAAKANHGEFFNPRSEAA